MTIPPATGRRKTRLVRDNPPPDDLVVLVRAAGPDVEGTRDDMARDARYSGDTYAVERPGGREVLFGVSVFALLGTGTVAQVLERFSASPNYLAVTVGKLRSAGFEVLPTGTNPNHFDVQLVGGVPADVPGRLVSDAEVGRKAAELIRLAGSLESNPAYAGDELPAEEP